MCRYSSLFKERARVSMLSSEHATLIELDAIFWIRRDGSNVRERQERNISCTRSIPYETLPTQLFPCNDQRAERPRDQGGHGPQYVSEVCGLWKVPFRAHGERLELWGTPRAGHRSCNPWKNVPSNDRGKVPHQTRGGRSRITAHIASYIAHPRGASSSSQYLPPLAALRDSITFLLPR